MSQQLAIFSTFGAYLVLLVGTGWWGERRFGSGYAGFIAADRSLSGWVAAISAMASSESAWVMLSLSGLGWKHGLAAYWAAGGCALGFIASSIFVVRQLRQSASNYSVLTLGDYFAEHLKGRTRLVRALASMIIAFFMIVYVVAQFTGAGKQMVRMDLMSYRAGVLSGALIVGAYVLIGGYAAVCWTDMIQGLLMGAVMIALPLTALVKAGGLSPVLTALEAQGIRSIWLGGQGINRQAIGFALTYFGFSLGYPGMPHAIIRYVTIRNHREAQRAAVIGAVFGTIILLGSATFGMFARASIPKLSDHETILPAFAVANFHPLLAGVMLAAVSAAMMSTADSQLMLAATALVHDIGHKVFGRREPDEQSLVRTTRMWIGILSLAALALAMLQVHVIDTLVLFAWGCLGAAFSPVILMSLYWKSFRWQGAVASFIVGPVTIILWQSLGLSSIVHGLIPGTVLSTLAAVFASRRGARQRPSQ